MGDGDKGNRKAGETSQQGARTKKSRDSDADLPSRDAVMLSVSGASQSDMDDVAGTTDGVGVVSSVDTSLTLLTGAASAWERQRGTPPQPQPVAAEEEKVQPSQQNQSHIHMG
ncbi:uncharacterized protein LOC133904066 [Phragmites australis]|uniref:uncharacterized protein LOC133904066 n=1 Tax=Phragmites australis TaxID=29695 RepID=UPI002D7857B4|nr:uncharacterized protein LOC133904066 [Phragmites australis]